MLTRSDLENRMRRCSKVRYFTPIHLHSPSANRTFEHRLANHNDQSFSDGGLQGIFLLVVVNQRRWHRTPCKHDGHNTSA